LADNTFQANMSLSTTDQISNEELTGHNRNVEGACIWALATLPNTFDNNTLAGLVRSTVNLILPISPFHQLYNHGDCNQPADQVNLGIRRASSILQLTPTQASSFLNGYSPEHTKRRREQLDRLLSYQTTSAAPLNTHPPLASRALDDFLSVSEDRDSFATAEHVAKRRRVAEDRHEEHEK
jgi:hypothetical protein